MIKIDEKKYFQNKRKMLDFIIENKDIYGDYAMELEAIIELDLGLKLTLPATLDQIFSKFNIYKDGKDKYLELVKLLEEYSFLEGNVCEVAAGRYPRLAELTAPKINKNGGNLTLYEPNIIFSKLDNMTIIKDKFTKNSNIDKFDTLYALYPCEATISIAEKAFEEDKNLMLAFCDCNNSTKKYPKWDIGKYWADSFCMEFSDKYGDEAEIIKWPSSTGIDTPILLRKSSKVKVKK